MSDRPSDLKLPDLKDVVIAVKDVAEWYDLGLQLGLPDATLASIAMHPDTKGHRRTMLSKWLESDLEASWEKLADALDKIGKNVIAANIRRQFVSVPTRTQRLTEATNVELASSRTSTAAPEPKEEKEGKGSVEKDTAQEKQDANKRLAVAETILDEIRSQFSLLVIKVRSAMQQNKVDPLDVHQFLVTFFEGECSIPEVPNLTKIFNAMTTTKLWRYDHYGPLEKLAKSFLPDDDPARAQVTEYKSQLTGFQATTRIIDFVKLNELEDREEIRGHIFSPKKYNSHYQKLSTKLELTRDSRDVSELTLEYVDKLWKALMKEFHLPPLTAVIDKIVEGSLTITWLLLPHIIEKIRATYFKSVNFFQQHNIINIVLYGVDDDKGLPLYDEEWMTDSTPLFRASFAGNIDEVKDLLEGGADVNETNDNVWGFTPLIGACITGQADMAKLLLDHKATVDYQTKEDGRSALYHSSVYGHTATVMVVLEYGAQVDLVDKEERTPLMVTCAFGSADVARVLLKHGANVDLCDEAGRSGLMAASVAGQKETVAVLLEYRAQVNLLDKKGTTALGYAVTLGYADVARVLLKHGANVDHCNEDGLSGLMVASGAGQKETVAVLLEYRAQVNLLNKKGATALAYAVAAGYADTARLLLENGATMNFEDDIWKKSLNNASEQGFSEAVKVALEYGAPVNLIVNEEEGNTALGVACENGQTEIARILLNHKATIDYQNKKGQSAVHLASVGGHTQTVAVLIEKGAQLNLQDQNGWTALLFAAQQGHLETVKLLLKHGAAVDIESKSGLTAVKVAQSESHQDACDILLQYSQQGTKVTTPQQEVSESRQEEETKAELAEEQRKSDTQQESAKVKSPEEREDEDSQRLPEDTQQERRESEKQEEGRNNRQQQETKTELTEAQKVEVRSVGEQRREKFKRFFLRERVMKELASQMRSEQGTSERIIEPTKQRISIFSSLNIFSFLPWRGQRT